MTANKKRLIYLIVYLAYTSIYISRVNLSVAETALEALSLFDAASYGLLGGLFSAVYSVGRLVNGRIGDKAPPWLMITVGLAFAGGANIAIGFLPPYIGMLLLWCTNAYAQSMLWSSVLCVVSTVYRGPTLKRMTSLMVTAVATGNILAILIGGWLAASVVLLFPSLGLAVAVVALGLVYAASSMVNTSITSIYPMRYLKSGNVSSVSGLLDFTSYLGAGISSAVYGVVIKSFGYQPMFISWIAVSVVSVAVLVLIDIMRKRKESESL